MPARNKRSNCQLQVEQVSLSHDKEYEPVRPPISSTSDRMSFHQTFFPRLFFMSVSLTTSATGAKRILELWMVMMAALSFL
jgi:hypothetical protein